MKDWLAHPLWLQCSVPESNEDLRDPEQTPQARPLQGCVVASRRNNRQEATVHRWTPQVLVCSHVGEPTSLEDDVLDNWLGSIMPHGSRRSRGFSTGYALTRTKSVMSLIKAR